MATQKFIDNIKILIWQNNGGLMKVKSIDTFDLH